MQCLSCLQGTIAHNYAGAAAARLFFNASWDGVPSRPINGVHAQVQIRGGGGETGNEMGKRCRERERERERERGRGRIKKEREKERRKNGE